MKQVVNTSASIVMLKVSIIDNLVLKYNDRLRRKRVNTTLFFAPQLFLKVPLLILLLVKVPFFNKISLEMVLAFQERRQSYGCQQL